MLLQVKCSATSSHSLLNSCNAFSTLLIVGGLPTSLVAIPSALLVGGGSRSVIFFWMLAQVSPATSSRNNVIVLKFTGYGTFGRPPTSLFSLSKSQLKAACFS